MLHYLNLLNSIHMSNFMSDFMSDIISILNIPLQTSIGAFPNPMTIITSSIMTYHHYNSVDDFNNIIVEMDNVIKTHIKSQSAYYIDKWNNILIQLIDNIEEHLKKNNINQTPQNIVSKFKHKFIEDNRLHVYPKQKITCKTKCLQIFLVSFITILITINIVMLFLFETDKLNQDWKAPIYISSIVLTLFGIIISLMSKIFMTPDDAGCISKDNCVKRCLIRFGLEVAEDVFVSNTSRKIYDSDFDELLEKNYFHDLADLSTDMSNINTIIDIFKKSTDNINNNENNNIIIDVNSNGSNKADKVIEFDEVSEILYHNSINSQSI